MMSSHKRYQASPSIKPVFALGGSVSGYASMGSIESLSGDLQRENKVWSTENIFGEELDIQGSQTSQTSQTSSPFKSSFAKELQEGNIGQSGQNKKISKAQPDQAYKSDFAGKVHCVGHHCPGDTAECGDGSLCQGARQSEQEEIPATETNEANDEFSRVKLENEILKLKLKSFNQEDEKYKKLQVEIEQLTWQLSKMEQSRLLYENATNQLGSFLEMVSTQLTLTKPGEANQEERMSRRRSRGSKSYQDQTLPRRKSTHIITTTSNKSRSKSQVEDPSLSSSASCASSSLNSSCASENGRLLARSAIKTLERVKERRERKSDTDDSTNIEKNCENPKPVSDSSLASLASECPNDPTGPTEKANLQKSKSRTRKALGRITSFMKKEKSHNFSLENSPKNSREYSSEHFSEPSSMSIIGFRGIWSLRNY